MRQLKPTLIFLFFILGISCNQPAVKEEVTTIAADTAIKAAQKDTIVKTSPIPTTSPKKEFVRTYNDNARFIAGLTGLDGSDFIKHEKNGDWRNYSAWFNNTWSRVKNGQLEHIKSWMNDYHPLAATNDNSIKNKTLFYPFSGADFLYANAFFPDEEKYVMIGLEPVGKVPDIRKIPTDFWENYFLALKTAQDDILTASFFKTKDMKVDFKIQELKGTLPILMIFLVRTGHTIVTMEAAEINENGEITEKELGKGINYSQINGVSITFKKNALADSTGSKQIDEIQKTIYYFPIDLSNTSIANKPNFEKFVIGLKKPKTFIKSASYLLHENNFASIRSIILNNSSMLVEDDSGIPLKYFSTTDSTQKSWATFDFYGAYKTPIPMFSKFLQSDLKNKFADEKLVKPLPFRFGYQNQTYKSNLMVAKKK